MKANDYNEYYSNGNLILTGEYFVLIGATSLVVPLKFGQKMKVKMELSDHDVIIWETYEFNNLWFKAIYKTNGLEILQTNNMKKSIWIRDLLKLTEKLKPDTFEKQIKYTIRCDIQYNFNWGWGSSSNTINNIATWAGIDPFELNRLITGGSGYDIAASITAYPFLYRINNCESEILPVSFDPIFKDSVYFIYREKKQSTTDSLKQNYKLLLKNKPEIENITELTGEILHCDNIKDFMKYMVKHEEITSKMLGSPRLKNQCFNDFKGEVKSLGAWGGDFFMVATNLEYREVLKYFHERGFHTIFRFEDIINN